MCDIAQNWLNRLIGNDKREPLRWSGSFSLLTGGERDLSRMKTCAMKLLAHAEKPAASKAKLRDAPAD